MKLKRKKRRIKNGGIPAWILDINNHPHAIEKARIGQEILDKYGLPKRPVEHPDI